MEASLLREIEWLSTAPAGESALDRDGDGDVDAWAELYAAGAVKVLRLASKPGAGPDFIEHYSSHGDLEAREVDSDDDGYLETRVRLSHEDNAPMEVTDVSDAQGRLLKRQVLSRAADGQYRRRSASEFDEDGNASRTNEQVLEPAAWSGSVPDFAPCAPGGKPDELSARQIEQLTRAIAERISVAESCNGFAASADAKPRYDSKTLRLRIARAVQSALRCLKSKGGVMAQKADQLVAQLFHSSARPLRISCELTRNQRNCYGVNYADDYCARATRFDEVEAFPGISLVQSCGRSDADLDALMLHELLHLIGAPGSQAIHATNDIEAIETIEPCTQCCAGKFDTDAKGRARQKELCALCAAPTSTDPIHHHSALATLITEKNPRGAVQQFEKVVGGEAASCEAWAGLLDAYNRIYRERPSTHLLHLLLLAQSKVHAYLSRPDDCSTGQLLFAFGSSTRRSLETKDAETAQLITQELNKPLDQGGLRRLRHELVKPYLAFVLLRVESQLLFRVCRQMSDQAAPAQDPAEQRARNCYRRTLKLYEGMKQPLDDLQALSDKIRAEPEGSSRDYPMSTDSVAGYRRFSQDQKGRLDCMAAGTALQDCPMSGAWMGPPRKRTDPAPPGQEGCLPPNPPETLGI